MAYLPMKCKPKEELIDESLEVPEDMRVEVINESVEKVILWFAKNDEVSSFEDCLEKLSLKSSDDGSNGEYDGSINTPSILSGSEKSCENSNKPNELKLKEYKPPVVPIILNHSDHYDVTLINFQSLDSFFVTINREDDKRWNRLLKRLKKIKAKGRLEPLDKIIQGTACLVEDDDQIHRAIVQNSNPNAPICYGIDNGKVYIIDASKDFIFYMPPKIRNTIEFQAINCKLFDVRMPQDPKICKLVYDTVISKIHKPQIKVVKTKSSRFIDDRCIAFNNYEVMLFDQDKSSSINQQIAYFIQGRKDYDLDNF